MTIDEAIAHAREVAEFNRKKVETDCVTGRTYLYPFCECIKCAEEHEQLAEWLEDYKQIKMLVPIEQALKAEYNKGYRKAENDYYAQSVKDRQSSYDCGYYVGYNKAIDNFAEAVKNAVTENDDIGAYDNPDQRICEILKIEAERLKAVK